MLFANIIPVLIKLTAVGFPDLEHCTIEKASEDPTHERHGRLKEAIAKDFEYNEF